MACLVEVDGQLVRLCGSTVREGKQIVTASTNGRLLEHFHEGNMMNYLQISKENAKDAWITAKHKK